MNTNKNFLESLRIGATIAANVNDANVDRAKGIKILKYGMKIWSEAQAKVATVAPHTRKEGMDGSTMKWFSTTVRRDYTEKGFGIGATKATTQEFGRRLLRTRSYNTAFQIDKDDLVGNEFNIHNVVSEENKKGLARLTDKICLSGLIAKPVSETTRSYGTNAQADAASALTVLNKEIGFAILENKSGTAVTDTAGTAAAFDLRDAHKLCTAITDLFQTRGIAEQVCITLTPKLRRIIQNDKTFRNLEDTYMLNYRSGISNTGFEYLGLTFVNTHYDVLPTLNVNNLKVTTDTDETAASSLASEVTITVRQLTDEPVDFGTEDAWKGKTYSGSVKRAKARNGDSDASARSDVKVKSQDMIYAWVPQALIFAERPELRFTRMSELPLHQYAEQSYDQVNIGAMCIDEDFALAIPLAGKTATES